MRISCLLMVLLVGLVSVCAAGDGARQSSSSQAAVNSFDSELISPSAIARQDLVRCQRIGILRAPTPHGMEM